MSAYASSPNQPCWPFSRQPVIYKHMPRTKAPYLESRTRYPELSVFLAQFNCPICAGNESQFAHHRLGKQPLLSKEADVAKKPICHI